MAMALPSGQKKSEFLHYLMARQLRLSIFCALCFFVVLFGLPLANYFLPDLMSTRLMGFTLSWFILGIAFFPFLWIISYLFIRRSLALEAEEVVAARKQNRL